MTGNRGVVILRIIWNGNRSGFGAWMWAENSSGTGGTTLYCDGRRHRGFDAVHRGHVLANTDG
jgi:hypothetical protein